MDEMDRLFRQSDFSAENEELEKRIWNRLKRYNEEEKIMPINKNELTKEMIAKAMLITARKILVCHLSSVNQAEFADNLSS